MMPHRPTILVPAAPRTATRTAVLACLACASLSCGGKEEGHPAPSACDAAPASATVEETGIPTVFRVTWSTPEPALGRVVFENGDGRERSTAWDFEPSTAHEALLVGMLPTSTIPWRVETEGLGECNLSGALETGALDPALPALSVIGPTDVAWPSWTITPLITTEDVWIVILDEEGRYIWAWEAPAPDDGDSGGTAPNARTISRARLGRDGRSVTFAYQAPGVDDFGSITKVGLDGSSVQHLDVTATHTDFVELPDGSYATLGWEVRTFEEGRRLSGDTLLKVAPDGTTVELWNVFDHYEPDLNRTYLTGFIVSDPTLEDWSHVNGLTWFEETGDFALTRSFDHGVSRIDGVTGEEEWSLGRDGAWAMEEKLISAPHSVQILSEDRLLVFNRGEPLVDQDACSGAVEIQLDFDDMAAEAAWSWTAPDCVYTSYLGEALRLPNGNTLVDFSSGGRMDEVTESGLVIYSVGVSAGHAFGFVERFAPLR